MFSGIVETTGSVLKSVAGHGVLYIHVERPKSFGDLNTGDSIAVNGVCLTVEEFDADQMRFALGPETMKITGWDAKMVMGRALNLERSLRLQDRIHGHLVTGHVDAGGEIREVHKDGDTLTVAIAFPPTLAPYIWRKGGITVNGVSLTINAVEDLCFRAGLIPETLRRTNLGELKVGATVNLEVDAWTRGLVHWASLQGNSK